MEFILLFAIVFFIFYSHKLIDGKKFIDDNQQYFKGMMEEDYEFFLKAKYGDEIDLEKEYSKRIRNGVITVFTLVFLSIADMKFINVLAALGIGFLVFKQGYTSLKAFYKRNLHQIDLQLPYFLKSLEILSQHYTIPVALSKSIESSPEVFRSGLKELVAKINAGNSTVEPYMDFARKYPVTDSVRMMRLLYRLSLGSQSDKHEQLILFSKSVSSLQNKARNTRYKERLDKMESKTIVMLSVVGLGVLGLLMFSMLTSFGSFTNLM